MLLLGVLKLRNTYILHLRSSPLLDFVLKAFSKVDIHFVLFKFVAVLLSETMTFYWIIWRPNKGDLMTITSLRYKSMESRHTWWTHIRVKRSDRRSFILILDYILVNAFLNMWMNLSLYPNLCKAEKIKSTLRISQKDLYSVYLTHQLCHK